MFFFNVIYLVYTSYALLAICWATHSFCPAGSNAVISDTTPLLSEIDKEAWLPYLEPILAFKPRESRMMRDCIERCLADTYCLGFTKNPMKFISPCYLYHLDPNGTQTHRPQLVFAKYGALGFNVTDMYTDHFAGERIRCTTEGAEQPSSDVTWTNKQSGEVVVGDYLLLTESMEGQNEWTCSASYNVHNIVYEITKDAIFDVHLYDIVCGPDMPADDGAQFYDTGQQHTEIFFTTPIGCNGTIIRWELDMMVANDNNYGVVLRPTGTPDTYVVSGINHLPAPNVGVNTVDIAVGDQIQVATDDHYAIFTFGGNGVRSGIKKKLYNDPSATMNPLFSPAYKSFTGPDDAAFLAGTYQIAANVNGWGSIVTDVYLVPRVLVT